MDFDDLTAPFRDPLTGSVCYGAAARNRRIKMAGGVANIQKRYFHAGRLEGNREGYEHGTQDAIERYVDEVQSLRRELRTAVTSLKPTSLPRQKGATSR
jgi:hypothetical protein